ncbi:MAG: hypothetical protein C4293_13705 [Nitrospiraceae bacterium]
MEGIGDAALPLAVLLRPRARAGDRPAQLFAGSLRCLGTPSTTQQPPAPRPAPHQREASQLLIAPRCR